MSLMPRTSSDTNPVLASFIFLKDFCLSKCLIKYILSKLNIINKAITKYQKISLLMVNTANSIPTLVIIIFNLLKIVLNTSAIFDVS